MKYLIFFTGLLITMSCNSKKQQPTDLKRHETSKPEKILSSALKIDTLNKWATKIGDTIRIRTLPKVVEFISKPNLEENISNFSYIGFNEKNDLHTVCAQYWELYECYLINQKTSRIDTLWTEPIFSPNNEVLVSKSMDYGLEGAPNGFQIWHLDNTRNWIKTSEIDQQEWIPIKFEWVTNDSIEIKTVTIQHYHQKNWIIENLTDFESIGFKIEQ